MGTSLLVEKAQFAASDRLSRAAHRQRRRAPSLSHYYGHAQSPEEIISRFSDEFPLAARVTRNHYGSLVLNASHALFIDVDVLSPNFLSRSARVRGQEARNRWRRTLDDLRLVLLGERDEGFRIYRTAAGYRVLAVSHEFTPGSEPAQRLMQRAGADTAFRYLCRVQNSFRARLTPKPWRCGTTLPPNPFPRETVEDRRGFDQWLTRYEHACRDRATCRFLESVGPQVVHEGVQPIIDVHDRETKAFESLSLA